MFERPVLLFLLFAAPLVAFPGLIAMRRGKIWAGLSAAALRVFAFAALVFALSGFGIPTPMAARQVETVALIDQSRSIAPDQLVWMRLKVQELARASGISDRLAVLGFGRQVRMLAPMNDPRLVTIPPLKADSGATDIADALTAADGLFSPEADKRIFILSDGNQTSGDAAAELPALVENKVRVFSAAPPVSVTQRVALTGFEAPGAVRTNQRFTFHIAIESETPQPVKINLELLSDSEPVGGQTVELKPGLNRFELPYRIDQPGAYVMGARLRTPASMVALNSQAEAALTVMAPSQILVAGSAPPESLLSALKLRQYNVTVTSPRSLPTRPENYLPYQAVVLSDASVATLSNASATALNRYVSDFGGGLIVTGETLRDERFAGTPLEKTLPVKFQAQPPPPSREPIAVFLCIDRSNSMSYDSRYPAVRDGERIRYAKAAAIALMRQLDDTDFAGVIAFDSQPYILGHLAPLGEDRAELENRIERLEPGGGTDFKDALEIAQREILDSKIAVRQIFLLTDGDTNRQYHDHDALIADFAAQHIPVSTIRIGPDLANLRLLQDFAQATGGTFYRVQDIEKLPLLLVGLTREAMNRRKQGRSELEAGGPSGILTGIDIKEMPPIDYYASTVPKDGAQVPVKITRHDSSAPLLAAWQYGLGRAVVFTADPDSLATLSWIRWNRYAEFWSQLVNWAMRQGDAGPFSLRVETASDGGLRVEAEKADNGPVSNLVLRVTGTGRAMDVPMTQTDAALYRGDLGQLPRGKYTAALMIKGGDTERVLMQREFASTGRPAADADEVRIRPRNLALLRNLATATGGAMDAPVAEILKPTGALITVHRSAEPLLLPLAIVLFLGEVFIRRRFLGD
ncbi:MAG TPA: VWA domain-containing protein [Candidatus Binataceae bacterium]|nr:VWA domain-containing protein [Candidatus Binataceae bacterium]